MKNELLIGDKEPHFETKDAVWYLNSFLSREIHKEENLNHIFAFVVYDKNEENYYHAITDNVKKYLLNYSKNYEDILAFIDMLKLDLDKK